MKAVFSWIFLTTLLWGVSWLAHAEDYVPSSLHEDYSSTGTVTTETAAKPMMLEAPPTTYTVKPGDTLWSISGRFFGDTLTWPKVWSYNPEVTNPHWIYPDNVLRFAPGGKGPAQVASIAPGRPLTRGSYIPSKKGSPYYDHEGYLDKHALKEAGDIAGSSMESMLLSNGNPVYIRFKGKKLAPGQMVTIFRPIPLKELEAQPDDGVLIRISGSARILNYDSKKQLARAIITESLEPIERGFLVSPMVQRFQSVLPVANMKNLKAKIVTSLYPLKNYAANQFVFINAGEKEGVRVGNRWLAVRARDTWRSSLGSSNEEALGATRESEPPSKGYPKEVVGEMLVLHVRPHSSTCVVTRSIDALEPGETVEMRRER